MRAGRVGAASPAPHFLVVPKPPKPIMAAISGSTPSSSSESEPPFLRLPDRCSSSFFFCAAASCSKPAGDEGTDTPRCTQNPGQCPHQGSILAAQ